MIPDDWRKKNKDLEWTIVEFIRVVKIYYE